MARMALRPALRAYAHAPAGVAEAFENTQSTATDGVDDGWRATLTNGDKGTFFTSNGYTISCWIKTDDPVNVNDHGWGGRFFGVSESASHYRPIAGLYFKDFDYNPSPDSWGSKITFLESLGVSRKFHESPAQAGLWMTGDTVGDGSGTASWVHIAGTSTTPGELATPGTIKIYINGTLVLTSTATIPFTTDDDPDNPYDLNEMAIGIIAVDGTTQYNAIEADHCSWWNKALDQAGIDALIDTSGGGSKPADLGAHPDKDNRVVWYQIGEGSDVAGSGGVLNDTMENFNMAAVNEPTFSSDVAS